MKIDHKEPRLRQVGGLFKLMPGVNDRIDPKQFAEAMKLPAFKALVEEGVVEVISEEDSADLSIFGTKKAIDVVARTVDRDLLNSWLKAEKRTEVSKAIADQLNKLKPDAAGKKDPNADGDKKK